MYEVERKEDRIIVRSGNAPVFTANPNSFLIHKDDGKIKVSKLKDMTDQGLLMALATIVRIEDLSKVSGA